MRPRRRSGGGDDAGPTQDIDLDELQVGEPENDPTENENDPAAPGPAAAVARTPMNRTVWIVAIVAVLALGAGVLLSRFVISPAQAAAEAEPPEPGLITVPVELRSLSSDVVARGDARYDDAVAVTVETSDLGGPAVVTGSVPEVGAQLDAGAVALEVSGRPVVVLPGEFPVYRTLLAGASGPDVIQLRDALNALGLEAGAGEVYDEVIAGAVERLYGRAGYPAPAPPEGAQETLEAAREQVRAATASLESARAALATAGQGATGSDRIRLDNAVNEAQRTLGDAKACAAAPAPQDPVTGERLPKEQCVPSVAAAEDGLRLARAEREEGLASPDTSTEVAVRDAAQADLTASEEAVAEAATAVLTPMPASEVVYVSSLPRRVDTVAVERGAIISGPAMTISGATLEIVADLARADADLLAVDQPGEIVLDDVPLPVTVAEIGGAADAPAPDDGGDEGEGDGAGSGGGGSDRARVVLHPGELTEEQRAALAGSNVRIRIPVSSTAGEVLAVPVAALTAGPGGESRVEVLRDGEEEPELVVVTTGLTASGYAEISSSEAPLEAGDRVVVGR